MDLQIFERFLTAYLTDDLPKRALDTLVFGGIAASAWSLWAHGARKRELLAFLKTHSLYVKRLKRAVDYIRSKGDPETFREEVRRDLNDTHARLKGQQLVLYALLGASDRKELMEYFDRIEALTKTFEFTVTGAIIESGELAYEKINRFRQNMAQLFKPNLADGSAVEKPVEHICLKLSRIVWSVYLLPITKTSKLESDEGKAVDLAFAEIRASLSKSGMSAEPRSWGDPQSTKPLLQTAAAAR